MTIRSSTYKSEIDGFVEHEPVQINCIDCHGSGLVSDETLQMLKDMKNVWCKCGSKTLPRFFRQEDGVHGWECVECGGVRQFG